MSSGGGGGMEVRCPQCKQLLAVATVGQWAVKCGGSEYVAEIVKAIRCGRCHLPWVVKELPGGAVILERGRSAA